MDLTKTLDTRTECLDCRQRSHNMVIFGWEVEGTPLKDAKRYFPKIGFNLGESFLAFRGPKTLRDGVF